MNKNVSEYTFRDAFTGSDTYKHNFTYEGLTALYEYLTEYEESTGEEIEFDMVALCCEYSEYPSAVNCCDDIGADYDFEQTIDELSKEEIQEEMEEQALKYLQDNTQVVKFDDGIIIQDF